MVILYVLILFAITALLVCVVPTGQYIYYRFVKKDQYPIKYYFSEQLFDRHMRHDVGLNDVRVINNRDDMSALWEKEMACQLP